MGLALPGGSPAGSPTSGPQGQPGGWIDRRGCGAWRLGLRCPQPAPATDVPPTTGHDSTQPMAHDQESPGPLRRSSGPPHAAAPAQGLRKPASLGERCPTARGGGAVGRPWRGAACGAGPSVRRPWPISVPPRSLGMVGDSGFLGIGCPQSAAAAHPLAGSHKDCMTDAWCASRRLGQAAMSASGVTIAAKPGGE